jgi:hypothetical protein
MYALPPNLSNGDGPRVTGITCPECAGSLEVVREGHGALRFICRVGHAVSVDELLAGKEEKIENDLWAAIRALEELATLLEDLEAYAMRHGRMSAARITSASRRRVTTVAGSATSWRKSGLSTSPRAVDH